MYSYFYKRDGKFREVELVDCITDKPTWRSVSYLADEIWRWDLPVDKIEVSELTAKECKLPISKIGEMATIGIKWNKNQLPIATPVDVLVADLPEGIFAIAHSSYPKKFPATCYLTDEERHCNRYKDESETQK